MEGRHCYQLPHVAYDQGRCCCNNPVAKHWHGGKAQQKRHVDRDEPDDQRHDGHVLVGAGNRRVAKYQVQAVQKHKRKGGDHDQNVEPAQPLKFWKK